MGSAASGEEVLCVAKSVWTVKTLRSPICSASQFDCAASELLSAEGIRAHSGCIHLSLKLTDDGRLLTLCHEIKSVDEVLFCLVNLMLADSRAALNQTYYFEYLFPHSSLSIDLHICAFTNVDEGTLSYVNTYTQVLFF